MSVMKDKAKGIMKEIEKELFMAEKSMQPFEEKMARGEELTDKELMKRNTLDFRRGDISRTADAFAEFIEELGIMTAMEIQWYKTTVREGLGKND